MIEMMRAPITKVSWVRSAVVGAAAAMICAGLAVGQVVGGGGGGGGGGIGGGGGFFGPGVVAYNPEPSAVFSGSTLHLGATVSADRKYVNLNMSGGQTAVTSVQTFPIYFAGGFVSTAGAGGMFADRSVQDPGAAAASRTSPVIVSTSAPLEGILARAGMTRLSGLD